MARISEKERTTLLANEWFASLPTAIFNDLVASAQRCKLALGEQLHKRGDRAADGVYVALTGSIRLSITSSGGREAIFTFFQPGNLFGEVSPFDGERRSQDAYAHKASELLRISTRRLEELLEKHPALCRSFLKLEASRLRLVMALSQSYLTHSLEHRFAGRLLALGSVYGEKTSDGLEIGLRLPQETLAQLAGVTRQRVNQLLKHWQTEGLIRHGYGRVVLTNVPALEKLAESYEIV